MNDPAIQAADLDAERFERRAISPSSAGLDRPTRFLNEVPEQARAALARTFPPGEEYLVRLSDMVAQGRHGILRGADGVFVPSTKDQDWTAPGRFEQDGEIVHLRGPVQYIARRYGENYFHWTYQCLAALLDMQEHGLPTDRLVVPPLNAWRRRTLELAGVDPDSCTVLEPDGLIRMDEALFSAFTSTRFVARPTRRLIELFETFADTVCPPDRHGHQARIYVSRLDAPLRPIANERKVCQLVEQYGFEVVKAEALSVDEQIRLFAGARCVVAPHGAGLVNLLYAGRCTSVTELLQVGHFNQCMFRICQAKGIEHYTLQADPVEQVGSAEPGSSIDLQLLEAHLQSLVSQSAGTPATGTPAAEASAARTPPAARPDAVALAAGHGA